MKAEKLYIKSIQKLSFKAFAAVSFVLLFIAERLPVIKIVELELSDVSDSFSVSGIGLGKTVKFFDYFGIAVPPLLEAVMYLALIMLVLGLAVLVMSFFGYRIIQVINFVASFVGFGVSIAFGVLITVFSVGFPESDLSEIMSVSINVLVWLPALLFLIGTVFTYAYAKMPGYSIAEGRFFTTLLAALNPKRFACTFMKEDNTEQLFRCRVPLKKKKYASLSEPKAIKRSKKAARRAKKNKGEAEPESRKLTPLQLALIKREHAEKVANSRADEENRALYEKQKKLQPAEEPFKAKKIVKSRPIPSQRAKSLEFAKRRAEHAEYVATRNDEIFY